ncbi:(4Fe-4S)-binding protein [Micromonospora taraxaci]|uniref:Putative Fe-S cluster protein YjdI n=1 Tax=Micromonospora taraxaci TaxID=1316803 RepID=A0A561W522_9ACTN|nr:putative Fe-S cluster protein YjdI [Micromonospora taraxaci]
MSSPTEKKTYEGQKITVTFEARRCLHAAECVRGLPEVFDPGQRPWIRPDGGGAAGRLRRSCVHQRSTRVVTPGLSSSRGQAIDGKTTHQCP